MVVLLIIIIIIIIIIACPILAREQYVMRKRVKLDKEHWYKHVPKSVEIGKEGK
jgi:hypothetical protein